MRSSPTSAARASSEDAGVGQQPLAVGALGLGRLERGKRGLELVEARPLDADPSIELGDVTGEGGALGLGLGEVVADALDRIDEGPTAGVVLIVVAPGLGERVAGMFHRGPRCGQGRLRLAVGELCGAGPLGRLLERGAGGTRGGRRRVRHPVAPRRSPSRVTTTASGWSIARSSASSQPPSTHTTGPRSRSSR